MTLVSEARRNLASHFRSVHVSTGREPDSSRLRPSAPALARWLAEYQEAYLEAQRSGGETTMHAMFGRSLTLEGDSLLAAIEDVVLLGEAAAHCGMSTTLTLTLSALDAHGHALPALHAAIPGLRFQIDCGSSTAQAPAEALDACRSTLLEHARRGGTISLVGDLGMLRASGLFEEELFNKTFVSLSARSPQGVRPQHKARSFSPCRDYIAWYVDSNGNLYPCAGLATHEPARFGSIHEPFAHLMEALACSERRMIELATRGPQLEIDDKAFPADLCALHRQRVHGIASL